MASGWNRGKGQAVQWLRDHANYSYDYCLIWPFSSLCRGYGQFGYLGKSHYAHRFMCELTHGPAPTPDLEAAHSCGRGHEGCVNPRHLSWKTKSENLSDSRGHGTQTRNTYGNAGRLSKEEAHQIWRMKGVKLQREVADLFKVSESTVSDIWCGRTHARPSKIVHWTPGEDAKLVDGLKLGYSYSHIAKQVGRPLGAVESRIYRLGLRSRQSSNQKHLALSM